MRITSAMVRPMLARSSRQFGLRLQSTTAATAPSSPLLAAIRNDLKTAMRSKDTNKLNVLRGLLAEVTNASKTSSPITTDYQVLTLLRKRTTAAKDAAVGFAQAGRADLKEKEDAQIAVLEQYAAQVKELSDEDIREKVGGVLESMEEDAEAANSRIKKGDVMKRLLGPGGALEGQPVDKRRVGDLVDDALGPR